MGSIARRLITFMCFATLLSCGGSGLSDADDFPSTGGDDPTAGLDAGSFVIGVGNRTEINHHVRSAAAFGVGCSILSTASNQDLSCYIDVPEGDLYFYGMNLVYNVPAGMCKYLRRTTYWYYNEEPGFGPTSISMDITLNADGTAITGADCEVDGGGVVPCNTAFDEVEFVTEGTDVNPVCRYDKTEGELANCCLGSYTLNKVVTTTSVPPTVTATNVTRYWSGKKIDKACIGGAGRTNWPDSLYTRSGYPASVVEFVGNGTSGQYEVAAPIQSTNSGTNIPIANFFTTALHTHGSFGTASTSTLPYYIEPLTDRNGTSLVSGNTPYTFECLDEAFEVNHRIRAYIREWDTYADYLAYIASSGVTEVPDRPGLENVNCDGVTGPCNDNIDADDFVQSLPGGVYQTVTPSTRVLNFPFDLYE